jgi:hypothetical protein
MGASVVELGADLRRQGVEVINATRRTALKCFEPQPLDIALAARRARTAALLIPRELLPREHEAFSQRSRRCGLSHRRSRKRDGYLDRLGRPGQSGGREAGRRERLSRRHATALTWRWRSAVTTARGARRRAAPSGSRASEREAEAVAHPRRARARVPEPRPEDLRDAATRRLDRAHRRRAPAPDRSADRVRRIRATGRRTRRRCRSKTI